MDDNKFFMIMLAVGGLFGLLMIIHVLRRLFSRGGGEIGGWELRGAWGRIRAVARTTIAEGLRAKIASGFALILLVSIPLFYFTAEGDGTIKGRIQMFISYSLGFSGFVLALLTIFFSCRSLSVEVSSRQIYSIVSKPIPRWQILAGKWAGVMFLNLALLTVAALAAWAGSASILGRFKDQLTTDLSTFGQVTPEQAGSIVASLSDVRGIGKPGAESPIVTAFEKTLGLPRQQIVEMLLRLPEPTRVDLRRYDELRRQVLVSRAAVSAEIPELQNAVDAFYKRLREESRLPEGWTEAQSRSEIEKTLSAEFCGIAPGDYRSWKLIGPRPEKGRDFLMSLRFKLRSAAQFQAATIEGRTLEEDRALVLWTLGDAQKPNYAEQTEIVPMQTYYELEIPNECVESDGGILLGFANLDPREIPIIIDLPAGDLEVLYRVGSFELNLGQAWLAMMIPLACLAAFGVCASTFLSFPVGSLIVITLFIISSSMGFVAESLAVTEEYIDPDVKQPLEFEIRKAAVSTIGWLLSIGDIDPVGKLIEGRSVGWANLWRNGWKFVLVKGMAVMAVAVIVFRRRELAAVIV